MTGLDKYVYGGWQEREDGGLDVKWVGPQGSDPPWFITVVEKGKIKEFVTACIEALMSRLERENH
jgi:hypothetical protein